MFVKAVSVDVSGRLVVHDVGDVRPVSVVNVGRGDGVVPIPSIGPVNMW